MKPTLSPRRVPLGPARCAAASWRRLGVSLTIALCLGAATGAHAQTPGNPDPGFTVGSNGSFSILGLQTGGKILLGGRPYAPVRVNPDGTPDDGYAATVRNDGFLYSPVAQLDGKVLVLGSEQILSRVNVDGTQDFLFQDPSFSSTVRQVVVQPDGRILVAVVTLYLSGLDPSDRATQYIGISRFLSDGTPDGSFTSGLRQPIVTTQAEYKVAVTRLAVQPNGQILIGTIAGVRRLNADGSLDTGFNSVDLDVVALATPLDGKIIVGVDNTGNGYASGLVRLNADGSVDTGFSADTGTGSEVNALALQGDGKIIVGGIFGQINGVGANNFARLNADGSVDTTLVGPGYGNAVSSLLLQPDGKVLVDGGAGLARYYAYTPVTTSPTAAAGMVGQPFSYQITANNAPASFTAVPLPDGLSLDAATGVISGTPAAAGTFQLVLGTRDAGGASTGFGTLTLAIAPIPVTPVITSATTAKATVTQSFRYQIRARNLPTSFAASPLPDGLKLDPATGIIAGVPTTTGTSSVALTAMNDAGAGFATLSLTVKLVPPVVPVITSASQATARQGQAFSYQITATETPTLFDAQGLPDGLKVDPATGLISGAPLVGGTFKVALAATATNADGDQASGGGTLNLTIMLLPVATLTATTPVVTAGSGTIGGFTLGLSPAPTSDVVVNFAIKGTATNGTDYVFFKANKKIKAGGKASKPIKVIPLGEGAGAGVKRTVVLTLLPGEGYTVGTTGKVKVKILGR